MGSGLAACLLFLVDLVVLDFLLFMVLIGLLRLIQKWAAMVSDRPSDGFYSSSEAR